MTTHPLTDTITRAQGLLNDKGWTEFLRPWLEAEILLAETQMKHHADPVKREEARVRCITLEEVRDMPSARLNTAINQITAPVNAQKPESSPAAAPSTSTAIPPVFIQDPLSGGLPSIETLGAELLQKATAALRAADGPPMPTVRQFPHPPPSSQPPPQP